MKIQSIANNSFMGRYIYHSEPGSWWTEYQPYSWENNNHSTPEPVGYIDILSSELPNNEQFIESEYRDNILQREYSYDIFGTKTSIYDAVNDKTTKRVFNRPSLNREQSLNDLLAKLELFRTMKFKHKKELDAQKNSLYNQIRELKLGFDWLSEDYNKGLLTSKNTKGKNVDLMIDNNSRMYDKFGSLQLLDKRSEELHKSINNLSKKMWELNEEVKLIKKQREFGKLIDISRRDIEDADRPLWNALKYDSKNITDYYVMLPHRTISMKKIFAQMRSENRLRPEVCEEVVRHITKLIGFMK